MDHQKIKQFGNKIHTTWKVFLLLLRWTSIVFFGVLFFLGLYFKLPWKVSVCIAVIPVVGLFVPRKIQPWVWGGLTLFIAAIWGWVHLPERNTDAWRPYEYADELDVIATDYYPADANNAAEFYTQVLEEYGETIFYFNFQDAEAEQSTLSGSWDPEKYPFLDFWLTEFEEGMEGMIEAAAIPQCRFEIPYNLVSQKPQMQRLNQMKGWARLLIRAANRDLFYGDSEEAFVKLKATLQIAQHLYQQQTLFDQSAAFQIELWGARGLETFVIDYCDDPQMLNRIEQLFVEMDPHWAGNWPDILLREKLVAKNLAALMYEVNDSGRIRISHSAMTAFQAGMGYRPRRLFFNQEQMDRLAVIGLWLSLPYSPQRLSKMVDERYDHYSLLVQKGEKLPRYSLKYVWVKGLNAQSMVDWIAMQQVGYFWALDGQYERHLAIVNQMHIFSGLKHYYLAHGQWPDRLDKLNLMDADYILTDPVSKKKFIYKLDTMSFKFYGLGPNGIDDGGVNDPKNDKDDILLWPNGGLKKDVLRIETQSAD